MHQLEANGNRLPQPIPCSQGDGILHMQTIEHVEAALFEQMDDAYYQKYNRPRLVVKWIGRCATVIITAMVWYHDHDKQAYRIAAEG